MNSIVYNINNAESDVSIVMIMRICYLIDNTAQNPPTSAEETFFVKLSIQTYTAKSI